ncbi:hypothetical protein TIFTF001_023042 [Ficus carica]|uniref:Uncharacterized protein n=1 Tax=Ficus carica TaxID=3494 RepID=A0AA88ADV5_FICCA|nr:hypothetical protein TIFTF001_023042 [Ficus carica]
MKLGEVKKTVSEEMQPPPGFPDHSIKLRLHVAEDINELRSKIFGINMYFFDRLSGLPFFTALRPPPGAETTEEALPEGFGERVGGRGVVHKGWIQHQLILEHKSVGCFVTHCGWGSLFKGLLNSKCELVMIPQVCDQIFNARLMADNLKVGVEEAKGEDRLFSRESVCDAIRTAMEEY